MEDVQIIESKPKLTIRQKLMAIQQELKAPKGQYNPFGKFNYRSCEDILEAVKPLLKRYNCILVIKDDIETAQEGRVYIRACVSLLDTESDDGIDTTAYARETDDKKGMDASQVTGTASSYARKYALNALFCIDDNKDADAVELSFGELLQNIKKAQTELTTAGYPYRDDKALLKGTGFSSHDPYDFTMNDIKGMQKLLNNYTKKILEINAGDKKC